jgi:hypothetical protein
VRLRCTSRFLIQSEKPLAIERPRQEWRGDVPSMAIDGGAKTVDTCDFPLMSRNCRSYYNRSVPKIDRT